MLAIHGIWSQRTLALWAEDADLLPAVQPTAAGQSHDLRDHPFAAAFDELADVLAEFGEGPGNLVRKAAEDDLILWLPTVSGTPAASPDLISEPATSKRPSSPRLAEWRVPALVFEPSAALALLAAIGQPVPGEHDGRSGRGVAGGSVLYLAAIGALGADLAARGRVLPGLDQAGDGSYRACWRPVLAGPDALRGRELTAAMPPLCRALSSEGLPSAAVFGQALDALADAAVRGRLAARPGFTLLTARPRAAEPLTERWLAALTGDSGELTVGPKDAVTAAQLVFALWNWQAEAQLPPGPVRTCFRLFEPAVTEPEPAETLDPSGWRVELAL
jgi:hypothetical protein